MNSGRRSSFGRLSVTLFLCLAELAGCAAGAQPSSSNNAAYQNEIDEVLATTDSNVVRQVLADGVISESEMSEVRSELRECLSSIGADSVKFFADGSTAAEWADEDSLAYAMGAEDVDGEPAEDNPSLQCESITGYAELSMLYHEMSINPHNEDMDELTVECLKEQGVVESSYTKADFEELLDNPNSDGSIFEQESFSRCLIDPLGLLPENSGEVEVQ